MNLAITEARRGEGRTRPNPPVGAVIVSGGRVIARGHHARAGEDHAEVAALRQVGLRAPGATIYVTLEPCAHHGRTPPCTEALLRAGVARVVIGARDPHPHTAGRGVERLRAAGIEVVEGVAAGPCARLIEGFASLALRGRPHVTLKLAATLDGRIATATGESRWITGPAARREVHRLRNRCDAVLVGAATVVADDPALTCRLRQGRDPLRVILSGRLAVPATARAVSLARRPGDPGTLIVTSSRSSARAMRALVAAGAEVVRLPGRQGRVDPVALLALLGEREVMRLLVEGGGQVAGELLAAGLVDRVLWFLAPTLIGGDGRPAIAGLGVQRLADALRLEEVRVRRLGRDLLVEGTPGRGPELTPVVEV
jgi:diaminohydroxyphosphoribosylaminopyrimidine deaminase/5-amino-6-(5-phosphoribosylamino)uracil reductase